MAPDDRRCDWRGSDRPGADACPGDVAYECSCARCAREYPEDRFHACATHGDSPVIMARHERIYPGHAIRLFPFAMKP